jgi:hypothetical protein
MKKTILPVLLLWVNVATAQVALDSLLPVRGFCISAPNKETLEPFITFIKNDLVPMHVNTLVLRVDYNYEYQSHPELRAENPLSKADVKKIVNACKEGGIRIIPQINMLGHQSWFADVEPLLKKYPQFNETPWVPTDSLSGDLKWPNPWGLYCLSYCPLHPDLHKILFDLIDEITDVFEADAFHAGMDEVFYLGDDKCPRCSGRDKAELFAGEVTAIRNHLALKNRELWIWGDRLIDGKTTGIGIWAASYNNTYRAIDMIPKDVVINDWQYSRPNPTAAMFALKGFRVVTCPYTHAESAKVQLQQMVSFRKYATPQTKGNYYGMMQTVWTSAGNFMDGYYGRKDISEGRGNQVECFKQLFEEINKLGK